MMYLVLYLLLGIPTAILSAMALSTKPVKMTMLIWAFWPAWSIAILVTSIRQNYLSKRCAYCNEIFLDGKIREHVQVCDRNPLVQKIGHLEQELQAVEDAGCRDAKMALYWYEEYLTLKHERKMMTVENIRRMRSIAIDLMVWIEAHDLDCQFTGKIQELKEIVGGMVR